ncbi:MAG: tRNA (adenosine(37)-N6)-dimethylallyltransferase MiaA [Alphaproteobacteria bacterium]|nr:tRNA (adenosine(37)-N6)-dimethylallyltransferase MiaA [Alphaproteobacteria bacterium]
MKPLLILGPTASGKTALALALAARLGGEIVNADAMQCYRDLRVLTARPTPEEEAQAPHHLFGVVDAAVRYSVGDWLRDAAPAIAAIAARGRTPIVVGGTGLAFAALTRGLVETPPIPEDVRAALAADLARLGAPALHARLAATDPEGAARLSPNDAPRIVRALEVLEATGAPLHALHAATQPLLTAYTAVALTPDRAGLYARTDARFDAMLGAGALEEARALAARGLDPALPLMKAHGMPWLAAHLRGEMPLEEAAALGKRDTRRYAKRQFTWIAHQAADWPRLADPDISTRIGAVLRLKGD